MSVRPTGRGAGIAGVGAAAIGAAYAFGTVALLPLGVGLVALSGLAMILVGLGSLRLEPTRAPLPAAARAGDLVEIPVGTARMRGQALAGLVVVRTDPRIVVLGETTEAESGELAVRLARGVHHLPPPRLDVSDAFGLARREKLGRRVETIVVPPRVVPLPPHAVIASGRADGEYRQAGVGTDLDRIREYHAGDPLSRVHWAQTAKRGRLQTKVLTSREGDRTTVLVAVDVGPEARADEEAFEESISVAASLAYAILEARSAVSLELRGGGRISVSRPTLRREVVDRVLAEVTPREPTNQVAPPPNRDVAGRLFVTSAPIESSPSRRSASEVTFWIGAHGQSLERGQHPNDLVIAPSVDALAARLRRSEERVRAA